VIRTQVQLTEEQARQLRRLAAERGVSVAQLIRESVEALLERSAVSRDQELRRRAMAAAGRFRSGQRDIAARHDDYLVEAYAK
jgi:16S rRNA U516 pseudouridylate synthase RsuA-like enzyme